MPLSAAKLGDPLVLSLIKEAIVLSDTSPTWLRWHDQWESIRSRPGDVAGYVEARTGYTMVTANKVPIHVKHAVWMLANNQPIPECCDVKQADGDASNFNPANLVLIEHKHHAVPGLRREYRKFCLPRKCALIKIDSGIKPIYEASVEIGKRPITVLVAKDPEKAVAALFQVAFLAGFLREQHSCVYLKLTKDEREYVDMIFSTVFVPVLDKMHLTAREKEHYDLFTVNLISAAGMAQHEAAIVPRPVLHLKAVAPLRDEPSGASATVGVGLFESTDVNPVDVIQARLDSDRQGAISPAPRPQVPAAHPTPPRPLASDGLPVDDGGEYA